MRPESQEPKGRWRRHGGVQHKRLRGHRSAAAAIEIGRRADLVLLDGDPMKNVKNVRRVAIVIKDGRIVARNDMKSQATGRPQ